MPPRRRHWYEPTIVARSHHDAHAAAAPLTPLSRASSWPTVRCLRAAPLEPAPDDGRPDDATTTTSPATGAPRLELRVPLFADRALLVDAAAFAVRVLLVGLGWALAVLVMHTADWQELAEPGVGGAVFDFLAVVLFASTVGGTIAAVLRVPPIATTLLAAVLWAHLGPTPLYLTRGVPPQVRRLMSLFAVSVIVVRAGLAVHIGVLRRTWRAVLALALLPMAGEAIVHAVVARFTFSSAFEAAAAAGVGSPWTWAFLEGFVASPVAPGVVVPGFILLKLAGYGVPVPQPVAVPEEPTVSNEPIAEDGAEPGLPVDGAAPAPPPSPPRVLIGVLDLLLGAVVLDAVVGLWAANLFGSVVAADPSGGAGPVVLAAVLGPVQFLAGGIIGMLAGVAIHFTATALLAEAGTGKVLSQDAPDAASTATLRDEQPAKADAAALAYASHVVNLLVTAFAVAAVFGGDMLKLPGGASIAAATMAGTVVNLWHAVEPESIVEKAVATATAGSPGKDGENEPLSPEQPCDPAEGEAPRVVGSQQHHAIAVSSADVLVDPEERKTRSRRESSRHSPRRPVGDDSVAARHDQEDASHVFEALYGNDSFAYPPEEDDIAGVVPQTQQPDQPLPSVPTPVVDEPTSGRRTTANAAPVAATTKADSNVEGQAAHACETDDAAKVASAASRDDAVICGDQQQTTIIAQDPAAATALGGCMAMGAALQHCKARLLTVNAWLWEAACVPLLFATTGGNIDLTRLFAGDFIGKAIAPIAAGVLTRILLAILVVRIGSDGQLREVIFAGAAWAGKGAVQAAIAGVGLTAVAERGLNSNADATAAGDVVYRVALLATLLFATFGCLFGSLVGPLMLRAPPPPPS